MFAALRHRLSVLSVAVLITVASVLACAAHRMPTLDDLALARFVAIGGTADDLCSDPGRKHALVDELARLCAPAVAPLLQAPAFGWVLSRPLPLRLGRHFGAGDALRSAALLRPAIRGPPPRA